MARVSAKTTYTFDVTNLTTEEIHFIFNSLAMLRSNYIDDETVIPKELNDLYNHIRWTIEDINGPVK